MTTKPKRRVPSLYCPHCGRDYSTRMSLGLTVGDRCIANFPHSYVRCEGKLKLRWVPDTRFAPKP